MKKKMPFKSKSVAVVSLLNFLSEAGLLKRVKRSGWWVAGISNPESVAEHSFRCAVIAYVLAKMEKVEPYACVMMALFNDIHEARINDLHKLGVRYIDFPKAEKAVFSEQMQMLPDGIRKELTALHQERYKQKTLSSVVARDADILECLIQSKEYQECGFSQAGKFQKKPPRFLKTASAKSLWRAAKGWDMNKWWEDLTKFER